MEWAREPHSPTLPSRVRLPHASTSSHSQQPGTPRPPRPRLYYIESFVVVKWVGVGRGHEGRGDRVKWTAVSCLLSSIPFLSVLICKISFSYQLSFFYFIYLIHSHAASKPVILVYSLITILYLIPLIFLFFSLSVLVFLLNYFVCNFSVIHCSIWCYPTPITHFSFSLSSHQ